MRRITKQQLAKKGACATQLRKFARRWPNGMTTSPKNAEEIVRLGLCVHWAASNTLSPRAERAFRRAYGEGLRCSCLGGLDAATLFLRLYESDRPKAGAR